LVGSSRHEEFREQSPAPNTEAIAPDDENALAEEQSFAPEAGAIAPDDENTPAAA
jgi:hypothetical protein